MSNFLPLGIRNILEKTDWSENEILVYSALLEKGAMDLSTISQETGLAISTVQYSIKQLLGKKMLSKTIVNEKPNYLVSDIEKLKKWIKGFTKQFDHYTENVEKFVEQYDFNPQMTTSKVRFYEGYRGVKQAYKQMLKDCKDDEICAFFSVVEDIGKDLQDFFVKEYVTERVKKGIRMKNIAMESPKALSYQKNDDKELRQTKLISKEFFPAINTEINLFDDYMHCMSFDEKGAFALIIQDDKLVAILKAIFVLLWTKKEGIYMTDQLEQLQETLESRKHLFTRDLKVKWKEAKPQVLNMNDGEQVMKILKHEVMSTYQLPYMQKLADIVTQNGGNILNVGYGLGLVDTEIEKFRKERKIERHYVIENNKHIASEARKNKNLIVLEGEWQKICDEFRGTQFDGIIYDGYPLTVDEVHRDGVEFIDKVVKRNLLKENGILTFYVDAPETLGKKFKSYLKRLGFTYITAEKVSIKTPDRERQIWKQDHFLAPIVKYK